MQYLWTDEQDDLWVLDSSPAAGAAGPGSDSKTCEGTFQLLKFDLKTDKLTQTYSFNDLHKTKSELNDVRVDHLHGLG